MWLKSIQIKNTNGFVDSGVVEFSEGIIYELEFRQSVQQGLDELDRGEGIPIEQVKAKIAAWAGK